MSDDQNTYQPTNAPYVTARIEDGVASRNNVFEMRDKLVPLLDDLRKRNPAWKFQADAGNGYVAVLNRFEVTTLTGEVIGKVTYDGYSGYQINNERIANEMERKTYKATHDEKVARRVVEKYFKPKTPVERFVDMVKDASEVTNRVTSNASSNLYRARSEFDRIVMQEAKENEAYYIEKLNMEKIAVNDAHRVAEFRAHYAEHEAMQTVVTGKLGGVYLDDSGKDITAFYPADPTVEGSKVEWETFDKLRVPEKHRGQYGLLKLVDVGEQVPNIGIRVKENLYFLMVEKEKKE